MVPPSPSAGCCCPVQLPWLTRDFWICPFQHPPISLVRIHISGSYGSSGCRCQVGVTESPRPVCSHIPRHDHKLEHGAAADLCRAEPSDCDTDAKGGEDVCPFGDAVGLKEGSTS